MRCIPQLKTASVFNLIKQPARVSRLFSICDALGFCFKGVTAGFAAAVSGAVANLDFACGAGVVLRVVYAVFYTAVNAVFGFTF